MKMKPNRMEKSKPWGRNRIPIAPPGSRHSTDKVYQRHLQPDFEVEWWDDLDDWEKNLPIERSIEENSW